MLLALGAEPTETDVARLAQMGRTRRRNVIHLHFTPEFGNLSLISVVVRNSAALESYEGCVLWDA